MRGTLVLLVGMIACDNSDLGDRCDGMDVPVPSAATTEGDVLRAQGSVIIEVNADFPCASATCVATLGRGGYCSQPCSRYCPDGFECRAVTEPGPYGEETFCVWKTCADDDDCGSGEFVCRVIPELSLSFPVKQCDFKDR